MQQASLLNCPGRELLANLSCRETYCKSVEGTLRSLSADRVGKLSSSSWDTHLAPCLRCSLLHGTWPLLLRWHKGSLQIIAQLSFADH